MNRHFPSCIVDRKIIQRRSRMGRSSSFVWIDKMAVQSLKV
jgi:hypothetical protein